MTNNLDTLATALYVKIDDLLKESPELMPWRPAIGIPPKLTDAELVTLAVIQALRGFTSESRWLRFARTHMTHLFRYLPGQSGYNCEDDRVPPGAWFDPGYNWPWCLAFDLSTTARGGTCGRRTGGACPDRGLAANRAPSQF